MKNLKVIGLVGVGFLAVVKLESVHYEKQIENLKTEMNYQIQITKLQAEKSCLEDKVKNQFTVNIKSDYNKPSIKLPPLPSNSDLSHPPF